MRVNFTSCVLAAEGEHYFVFLLDLGIFLSSRIGKINYTTEGSRCTGKQVLKLP